MQEENRTALWDTALAYASAGFSVIPIKENSKIPATKNGLNDRTDSIEQINKWWSECPNYNVAICPADSNLFVVDIDPGADLSIREKLPPTYQVRTPRGGTHDYYEGTGKSTAGALAEHVDTRSIGGYVLVPPSLTEHGAYTVERAWPDYAPLPDWILEALATSNAAHVKAATDEEDLLKNINRAISYLKKCPGLSDVKGSGSDTDTYKIACKVKDLGISQDMAFNLMNEHWIPRCEGLWEDEWLKLKILNAYTHGQNEQGAFAVGETPKEFEEFAKQSAQEETPKEKLSRFYFKDEAEQDAEPDPTWLVKDLLSGRSTVMIYGKSGSFKSFLVLDICLAIATGKPTFSSETKPGLVFYGALEGKAHLKKGRKAWRILKNVEGKIDNFFVGRAPMISLAEELVEFGEEIKRRCAGRRPSLIVIDTLSKSMAGMNENDASDANRFIQFCDALVEGFGCTVIAVHHASDKDSSRGARGSSAFLAGFDTVLEVVRPNKRATAVSVKVEKHKDAAQRELPWTFEGKPFADSLVFETISYDQYKLLAGDSKDITTKTVGAALKKLNAFGADNYVTTTALAIELTPVREDDTVEERAEALSRTSRVLTTHAKAGGLLEAYAEKTGREWRWFLATPDA